MSNEYVPKRTVEILTRNDRNTMMIVRMHEFDRKRFQFQILAGAFGHHKHELTAALTRAQVEKFRDRLNDVLGVGVSFSRLSPRTQRRIKRGLKKYAKQ